MSKYAPAPQNFEFATPYIGYEVPTGESRGATDSFIPTEEEIGHIRSFVEMAGNALHGIHTDLPATYQINAYDSRQEEIRDAIVHALGETLGFDVDRELNSSEQDVIYRLDPFDKGQLGLDNPEEPSLVKAILRSVNFNSTKVSPGNRPSYSFAIHEVEFDNNLVDQDGAVLEERKMRILKVQHGFPDKIPDTETA
jgi:hypothetical protein